MAHLARISPAVLLLILAGCSGADTGRVAGKVTLQGQPLAQGSVVFEDTARGISVNASLQSDGSYTVTTFDRGGLAPGTYQVAVTPSTFGNGETPLAVDPSTQAAPAASPIPEKYRRTATSGLTATVKAGANPPFNFDLTP